jgi:hypothetical protein
MLPSLLRWWFEFFSSVLGDSAFAKFLAGALALVVTPVAVVAQASFFLALLGVVVYVFGPLGERLLKRVAFYMRDRSKR